ncbi:MAG: hypothetical protein ACJKTH_00450 [Patescibacteria group bacterium UBA2163]
MSDTQKDTNALSIKDSDKRFRLNFKDFLKNEHHGFVVEKTEKLASALYLVTGFIPSNDPLRTRLRMCAVELVSATTADQDGAGMPAGGNAFASRCLEIGTILKLAHRAGFVSSMNADVLSDEYAELANFVKMHYEKVFGAGALNAEVGGAQMSAVRSAPARSSALSLGQKDAPATPKNTRTPSRTKGHKRHTPRREAILRLLDKKDKITVKDVAAHIQDCSEKTLQRELISMVTEGVLLKEGERRWSTYRRAS